MRKYLITFLFSISVIITLIYKIEADIGDQNKNIVFAGVFNDVSERIEFVDKSMHSVYIYNIFTTLEESSRAELIKILEDYEDYDIISLDYCVKILDRLLKRTPVELEIRLFTLILEGIVTVEEMDKVFDILEAFGLFTVTAYCSCEKCCGEWADGVTYSGNRATWGTVAVDRKIIRLGSKLRIEGFPDIIFRCEDVGGSIKGNKIDIWFPNHQAALNFGVQKRLVYIIRKGVD